MTSEVARFEAVAQMIASGANPAAMIYLADTRTGDLVAEMPVAKRDRTIGQFNPTSRQRADLDAAVTAANAQLLDLEEVAASGIAQAPAFSGTTIKGSVLDCAYNWVLSNVAGRYEQSSVEIDNGEVSVTGGRELAAPISGPDSGRAGPNTGRGGRARPKSRKIRHDWF